MLLAVLGSAVIVASGHFASLFLGLEILSISLYALIAYSRLKAVGVEAGLKYLVLAATSAAFLVFGMALIYAALGTMELTRPVAFVFGTPAEGRGLPVMIGLVMLLVGIGFKLAVVPFHLWTPDVYQGAPAPVTAFVATVSKGSLVGLILRFFGQVDIAALDSLFMVFSVIVVSSMIFGNILALLQNNLKRLLAYSSIAHMGYLLVAFLVGGSMGATAATFYLIAYVVMTLGAFGVITVLSVPQREAERIDDYKGLFWRRPWLGGTFTAMLLSLAGIPLTVELYGQVLPGARGRKRLFLVVGRRAGDDQRHRAVLLPAGGGCDVRPSASNSNCNDGTAPERVPDAGRIDLAACLARPATVTFAGDNPQNYCLNGSRLPKIICGLVPRSDRIDPL